MGSKGFLYMGLLVSSFLLISSALAARDLVETTIDQQQRSTTETKGLGSAKYQYGGYGLYGGHPYESPRGHNGYRYEDRHGNNGRYVDGGYGGGFPGYGQLPKRGGYCPNGC